MRGLAMAILLEAVYQKLHASTGVTRTEAYNVPAFRGHVWVAVMHITPKTANSRDGKIVLLAT